MWRWKMRLSGSFPCCNQVVNQSQPYFSIPLVKAENCIGVETFRNGSDNGIKEGVFLRASGVKEVSCLVRIA
jgi:hypothetical protein